jgi:hypothetical protein
MKAFVLVLTAFLAVAVVPTDSATAAVLCPSSSSSSTAVHSAANAITLGAQSSSGSADCAGSGPTSSGFDINPIRDSDLDGPCVREAITQGEDPFAYCDLNPGEIAPMVTPGLVGAAFRRLPLPASELVVQPPGGRTLVNFATNFYTENGEFTRTVSLLGQRVVLRIWPAGYGWRFGDGAVKQTVAAGSPYPDLEITHRYLSKGRVAPRVDTTYAARFRVNGGPWRDVAGTVTVPGAAQGLRVVEARPVLVGY